MENNIDIKESLGVINNLSNSPSWFGENVHRWPLEATPLGYAMACVEVVSKKSEKAGVVYHQIIEAWGRADTETLFQELISDVPEAEIEEIKQIIRYPERVLEPDYGKPFKDYEEVMKDPNLIYELFENESDFDPISQESLRKFDKAKRLLYLVLKFILVGFNRETDLNKGKFPVLPSEKAPWLTLAIMYRTGLEYKKITTESYVDYTKYVNSKTKLSILRRY